MPFPIVPAPTTTIFLISILIYSLDNNCACFSPADANGGHSPLNIPLLHCMKEGNKDSRPAGSDRMAKGNRSAIDVNLVWIQTEHSVDDQRDYGECFVDLKQVDIVLVQSALLQDRRNNTCRSSGKPLGFLSD